MDDFLNDVNSFGLGMKNRLLIFFFKEIIRGVFTESGVVKGLYFGFILVVRFVVFFIVLWGGIMIVIFF